MNLQGVTTQSPEEKGGLLRNAGVKQRAEGMALTNQYSDAHDVLKFTSPESNTAVFQKRILRIKSDKTSYTSDDGAIALRVPTLQGLAAFQHAKVYYDFELEVANVAAYETVKFDQAHKLGGYNLIQHADIGSGSASLQWEILNDAHRYVAMNSAKKPASFYKSGKGQAQGYGKFGLRSCMYVTGGANKPVARLRQRYWDLAEWFGICKQEKALFLPATDGVEINLQLANLVSVPFVFGVLGDVVSWKITNVYLDLPIMVLSQPVQQQMVLTSATTGLTIPFESQTRNSGTSNGTLVEIKMPGAKQNITRSYGRYFLSADLNNTAININNIVGESIHPSTAVQWSLGSIPIHNKPITGLTHLFSESMDAVDADREDSLLSLTRYMGPIQNPAGAEPEMCKWENRQLSNLAASVPANASDAQLNTGGYNLVGVDFRKALQNVKELGAISGVTSSQGVEVKMEDIVSIANRTFIGYTHNTRVLHIGTDMSGFVRQ